MAVGKPFLYSVAVFLDDEGKAEWVAEGRGWASWEELVQDCMKM